MKFKIEANSTVFPAVDHKGYPVVVALEGIGFKFEKGNGTSFVKTDSIEYVIKNIKDLIDLAKTLN